MGVQDEIILPSRGARTRSEHPLTEYGASPRVYSPGMQGDGSWHANADIYAARA